MMTDNLKSLVLDFVARSREGVNWDFKKEHHQNKANLIHDVLCLANADFDGDRYLIYGVEDGSFNIVGLREEGRKKQADIVNFFRSNAQKFEAHRTPEMTLQEIDFKGKVIEVLTITNLPHKPYRLLEAYKDKGTVVWPSIYTRREDVNTPINKGVNADELEVMFKERFGLSLPPHRRLLFLLKETCKWRSYVANIYFHEDFPEFTYEYGNKMP